MQEPESQHEEWMEEAPLLASLRGKQPVEAPEGYFDALPKQVMARIQAETPLESGGAPLRRLDSLAANPPRRRFNPRNLAIAAGLALLVAVGAFWVNSWQAPAGLPEYTFAQQLEALSDEAIVEHLAFSDLDRDELTALVDEETIASIDAGLDELGQETVDYLENMDWEDLDLEALDLGDLNDLNINFEPEI